MSFDNAPYNKVSVKASYWGGVSKWDERFVL